MLFISLGTLKFIRCPVAGHPDELNDQINKFRHFIIGIIYSSM